MNSRTQELTFGAMLIAVFGVILVLNRQTALLGAGSDPNAADPQGQTALHLAAAGGHPSTIRVLLGAGGSGLEELITALQAADRAKNEEIKQKLITMRNAQVNKVLNAAIGEAEFDLKAGVLTPTTVTVTGLSLEDFSHAGKLMEDRLWGTVILRFPEESSVMLFSDGDYDCGAAVKEHTRDFEGKGGGSDVMARAIFKNSRDMDAFLERLGASKDLML